MPDFIIRMFDEYQELALKIYKARQVLADYSLDDKHSLELLDEQVKEMISYFSVLGKRIFYEVTQ